MKYIRSIKKASIVTLMMGAPLFAQQDTCELDPGRAGIKIANLDRQPSWFISVNPINSDLVGYIGGGNRIINMNVERGAENREITIPGSIDPVYSPDGLFMTMPNGGLAFIETQKLESAFTDDYSATDVQALFNDREMSGAYQSVGMPQGYDGVVQEDGSTKKVYRSIIEQNDSGPSTLSIREYTVTITADGEISPDVEMGELMTLCPNRKLKTPKISKTGKYLAAYDFEAEITKIFRLVDVNKCDEIPGLDFDLHTGKVDFNFDDSLISFHISRYEDGNYSRGFWPSTISDSEKRDVFVAKMIKDHSDNVVAIGHMTRVSPPTTYGEGAWYPTFSNDNTLVYMTRSRDAEGQPVHSLVKVNPLEDLEYTPYLFSLINMSEDETKDIHATYALASLAGETCEWGAEADIHSLLMDISIMKPEACRSMVTNLWDSLQGDVRGNLERSAAAGRIDFAMFDSLTKDDLTNACATKVKTQVVNVDGGVAVDQKAEVTINTTCGYCHTHGNIDGIRRIDFTDVAGLNLEELNLSINSINYEPQPEVFETEAEQEREIGRKMPSSETFDERTKTKVACYFYEKRAQKFPSFQVPSYCEGVND